MNYLNKLPEEEDLFQYSVKLVYYHTKCDTIVNKPNPEFPHGQGIDKITIKCPRCGTVEVTYIKQPVYKKYILKLTKTSEIQEGKLFTKIEEEPEW
jgi:phage FluMu protein Com